MSGNHTMPDDATFDDAVAACRSESFCPYALINLAVRLEQQGRLAEAIRLYEDGIRHAQCLEFYVNLATLWISEKRPDRAVVPLQKAIELAPGCVPAHVNLAGRSRC